MEHPSFLFRPTTTYKPLAYQKALDMCVEHERMHWHEGELELAEDVSDWKLGKLTQAEKEFITQILRMFTQADLAVGGYYTEELIPNFKNNEVRVMLTSFTNREGTHQRAYALLNDTLGLPEADYTAFLNIKEMNDKDEFMRDADPSTLPGLAKALAKGTFNEGVSLFASFVMLLNFQRRGTMKGMGKVVEWSVKDESKHVEGVTWLFRQLCAEVPEIVTDRLKSEIYVMATRCVELEDAFIDLAFGMNAIEGMTADEVKTYIRFIADRRLTALGLKELWRVEKNPLPWVDVLINAPDHTNFFENKVAEYELGSLVGDWDYSLTAMRMYGRQGCDFCVAAKDWLASHGIPVEYVDLTDNDARQAFYDTRGFEGGRRTVPKIYRLRGDDEELVGGYAELVNPRG